MSAFCQYEAIFNRYDTSCWIGTERRVQRAAQFFAKIRWNAGLGLAMENRKRLMN